MATPLIHPYPKLQSNPTHPLPLSQSSPTPYPSSFVIPNCLPLYLHPSRYLYPPSQTPYPRVVPPPHLTTPPTPSPIILIPEEHVDAVDDVRLVELYSDALAPVSGDGVCGVTTLTAVVLSVSIQQGIFHLALNGGSIAVGCGHILLLRYYTTTNITTIIP